MNNPIRYVPGAIGALLLGLCMPVVAQNALSGCQVEVNRSKLNPAGNFKPADMEEGARELANFSCSAAPSQLLDNERKLRDPNVPNTSGTADYARAAVCILRAVIKRCATGASASNKGSNPNLTTNGDSSRTPAPQQAEAARLASKRQADIDKARQEELKRKKEKSKALAELALMQAKGSQEMLDEDRKGKRKRHSPEGEAHNCLQLKKAGLYGGFNNSCSVPVTYYFCHYQPRKDSWGESLDCEKGKIGMGSVQPNTGAAEHTYNSAMVYWFACKKGFNPADAEFVLGQGLRGRCVA